MTHLGSTTLLLLAAGAALAPAAAAQCQKQKLTASDMAQKDEFGTSVAMSGDWAVIGAPQNDDIADQSGAAYVFERQGGAWVEVQKLKASDAEFGDLFGQDVVINGSTLMVSAPLEDPGGVFAAGSVYVFELQGSTWFETQKLSASDADGDDQLGWAIAMAGSRAVFGAKQDEDAGANLAGSAYVFEEVNGTWTEMAKLTASDPEFGDGFGRSVSIDGDLALVGSAADAGGNKDAGVAYLFEFTQATGWQETQKLMASDGEESDLFGWSVVVTPTQAVIGAHKHDGAAFIGGAAYVFENRSTSWVETQKLVAADPGDISQFGVALALDGVNLIVTAPTDDDGAAEAGAAYVFQHDGSSWSQKGKVLADDGSQSDLFGVSVALEDGMALVGACSDDDACPDEITCDSGAAYVFHLAPTASQFCSCATSSPCANHDDHGGCESSLGEGAVLSACGPASVSADDLELVTTRRRPGGFALLFMGPKATATPKPLGDGLRCVGGQLFRFPVTKADGIGKVTHTGLVSHSQAHFPSAGQITSGSTWHFQDWYRDPQGPCGSTFNVSNAVRVTFVP